ncbi:MAG: prepilin peptidase [Verrucomicrobiota bacterium]
MTVSLSPNVITAISAVFGALVGSFLNVCIYRLPLGLSVRTPARSYCPHCRKTIPWWENLPILSWLLLRGRCSTCKSPIHIRYLLVEVLTALLFAAAAIVIPYHSPLLLLPYFTLLGILIVATFVDLEHMIIPDEITWGGAVAGLIFSLLLPELHSAQSNTQAFLSSLLGAGFGFGSLWAIATLGRLAFGRKRMTFATPTPVRWIRNGDEAELSVGEDLSPWGDFFFRGTEKIRMGVLSGDIDGKPVMKSEALWTLNHIQFSLSTQSSAQSHDLNQIDKINLQIEWLVFPREAMGFGDVKFLAAIGSFLGWRAALFTIVAASCLGALYGLFTLLIGKRQWSAIPFGPYLATAALIWIATGPNLVAAYWALVSVAH